MQNDEVIWQVINHGFCSFKTKIARERTFCQNPYNVTGLCLRSACPLANSQYATIREEEGICYLYMKTIERAHTPKYLWEKIKLPDNYMKALELISKELEYFPKYLVHRNKQRLTKIHQMLIRMRKLKLKARPKIVTTNTKIEQREKGREAKALKAAQLEKAIEKELLERLRQATDNEILNYPERNYNKVLSKAASKFKNEGSKEDQLEDPDEEAEEEEEGEEEDRVSELNYEQEEEEEGEEDEYNVQYVEDFEESDEEIEDLADRLPTKAGSKKRKSHRDEEEQEEQPDEDDGSAGRKSKSNKPKRKKRKGTRVEVEYEQEDEEEEPKQKVRANPLATMDFNF